MSVSDLFFQGKKKWLGIGRADSSLTPWWVSGTEMTHLSHGDSMEQKQFIYPWWVNETEITHLSHGESMEQKQFTYPLVSQ